MNTFINVCEQIAARLTTVFKLTIFTVVWFLNTLTRVYMCREKWIFEILG